MKANTSLAEFNLSEITFDENQVRVLISYNNEKITKLEDDLKRLYSQNKSLNEILGIKNVNGSNENTGIIPKIESLIDNTENKKTVVYKWREEIRDYINNNPNDLIDAEAIETFITNRDGITDQSIKKDTRKNISITLSSLYRTKELQREHKPNSKSEYVYKKKEA